MIDFFQHFPRDLDILLMRFVSLLNLQLLLLQQRYAAQTGVGHFGFESRQLN